MFRATSPRGEDVPTVPRSNAPAPTSIEGLLALGLCTVVVLASVAFLRRSSDLSRALAELQSRSLVESRESPRAVRRPRAWPGAGERPELVILISIDTLRADRLELYGYGRTTAPHLAALGSESVVFRTVCAQSTQTLTSHKSLFTGKYPATLIFEQTGADLLELSTLQAPREFLVTNFSAVRGRLAAGLAERGYHTAGFTDGAWMSREAGFAHGFDVFDDSGGGLEAILPRGLAWLAANGSQPGFLFLHAYDVHCPYTSREPFDSTFCKDHTRHIPLWDKCGKGGLYGRELTPADLQAISDHYDGGILSADDYLGHFFDELRLRGLYDRALIVVTSDHGESLGERGVIGHGGLHVEELFVPLILKFPADWSVAPITVSEPVELVDVLPTLFALCGAPVGSDLDGRSLLPTLFRGVRGKDYLLAQTTFEEGPELSSNPAKRTLLRPGRWQVIHDPENSQALFFALERDPAGLEPHAIQAAEFTPFLDVLIDHSRKASRPRLRASAPVQFSAEIANELDRLGYGAHAAGEAPAASIR